jgi:hypothetical protein
VERKGKENNNTTHRCEDPNNHYNHCNINGHIEDRCLKLHQEMNLKNYKKDTKKKNILVVDSWQPSREQFIHRGKDCMHYNVEGGEPE